MRNLKLASTLWLFLCAAPLPLLAAGLGSGAHALRVALPASLPQEGLVILKHREGSPFELADFLANPERYAEDFVPLTRAEDQDDWTVSEGKGRVVTHLDREDLFIVAAGPGMALDVEWGDVALVKFFERQLAVEPDADGCYSSLASGLRNRDGSETRVPHRLFYCPGDSAVLFDAPDGYEIGLTALRGEERVERTEASPFVSDNLRLYVHEVYPRSPSRRATGCALANARASLRDAGRDLRDLFGHAVTGTFPRNIHTGQDYYRPSPLTAAPVFVWQLFHLEPGRAFGSLLAGPASGVQVAADAVSASSNAVLNPALQLSVGAISPRAADRTGDGLGAVLQALAKNLPLAERSTDAFNPMTFVRHDRAFQPATYTRTDTQLNIDRAAAVLDVHLISRYRARRNDDSRRRDSQDGDPQGAEDGSGSQGGAGGGSTDGGGSTGGAGSSGGGSTDGGGSSGGGSTDGGGAGGGGMDGGGSTGGGGSSGGGSTDGGGSGGASGGGGGSGSNCNSRGSNGGGTPGGPGGPNGSDNAIDHLDDLFCSHPILNSLLPTR